MIDPAPARIELRHLRSFVAVAEERHFRRAAERLHMSQPPLSQQIKVLEEALGVRLLDRDRRGVEVTPAGLAFLEQARSVLLAMDNAVDVARRAQEGEIGRLAIGFVGSSMYGRVPELLREFRTAHPGVRLSLREVSTAAQVETLIAGDIDVGFLRPPVIAQGMTIEPYLHEDVIAALPEGHPLTARAELTVADLRDEHFVMLSRAAAPGQHEAIMHGLAQAGGTPRIVQEAEELQTVIGLVATGLGVSLVPASVRALERHDVVYREFTQDDVPTVELAIAYRTGDASPVLQLFLDEVRARR